MPTVCRAPCQGLMHVLPHNPDDSVILLLTTCMHLAPGDPRKNSWTPENIILSELSQTEKDKYYMIPCLCGIQTTIPTNPHTRQKQTCRHRKHLRSPKGRGMQTTAHETGQQQGFTAQHRELYSASCNKLHWNIIWKKKTGSLCCISETNTVLSIK